MPITDSATFEWQGRTITITRKSYDALTIQQRAAADQNWMHIQGKVIGTGKGGNTFKRWTNMFGDPRGYEFRPLRMADYGYIEDFDWFVSSGMWSLETIGNFNVGLRQGFLVLATSMLLNDFVRPLFKDAIGSSFVYNIQGGFNLYHYMNDRSVSEWTKAAAIGIVVSDIGIIGIEHYRDYEFNTMVANDLHALGLGIGVVMGVFLNRMM